MAAPFHFVSANTNTNQVTSSSVVLQHGVTFKAADDNSGRVAIGISNAVTYRSAANTDGWEIEAGASVFVPVRELANLNSAYYVASAANQRVMVWPT